MTPPDETLAELPLADLPVREPGGHKGRYGNVLLVAGSRRYPGAAVLAALGAGRAGAGLVRLAVPAGIEPLVLPAVPFAILLAADAAGGAFAASAAEAVLEEAAACDAVALGPGLDGGQDTGRLVRALVTSVGAPLVLDADGLNHLAREPDGVALLRRRRGRTVLTPHPGEFARLDGGTLPRGEDERRDRALALARASGAVVVLKGHRTVVTDGHRVRVEAAGNPGLATGGTGDVLTGILAALLAVLPDPASAAALGVHLHARAGDLAAAELGEESVLPADVADRFGRALRELRAGR